MYGYVADCGVPVKASQMISVLGRLIQDHGDLPVEDEDGLDITSVFVEYAESDVDNAFRITNESL